MKGYKVFEPDWTCRGFQYEVGKTYEEDVTPRVCERGFHFCKKAADCFSYYPLIKVKSCRSYRPGEVMKARASAVRSGSNHTRSLMGRTFYHNQHWRRKFGLRNSGNGNSGDQNSGDQNSGDWNSGNGKQR